MHKIKLLDEITANQIAAGEVIERPSSVVKELVENSLDAGANKISVFLFEGGIKGLRIVDDGSGMSKEDALMAFSRHATSKITTIEDLESLKTLGFRGEALASIASVATVELITRTKETLAGTKLTNQGGKITSIEETGCPVGTSIEINNLFFNTPARKKHLKSQQRELATINDLLHKLGLGNPSIGFSLYNNNKMIFNFSSGLNLQQRLIEVFGVETSKEMIFIDDKNDYFTIKGYVGRPIISRANRSQQNLFINNRYIKSKIVSEAIESGYHTFIMINRYPIFAINLEVNPAQVDVNVHPSKMEVRFDKEEELRELLTRAVSQALGHNFIDIKPRVTTPRVQTEQIKLGFKKEPTHPSSKLIESFFKEDGHVSAIYYNVEDKVGETAQNAVQDTVENKVAETFQDFVDEEVTVKALPNLWPLGQINATYIICQGDDGLYMIDQHAAHERILYEKLMKREKEKTPAQQMLIASSFELKSGYAQLLIENILLFSDLGFIIEHFGGDTFIIRGIPEQLSNCNEKEILLDLLDSIKANKSLPDHAKIREKVLISMACKGAIKAGEKLEHEEILRLLNDLDQTQNPFTCPHGRPVMVHINSHELDKKFKRIV